MSARIRKSLFKTNHSRTNAIADVLDVKKTRLIRSSTLEEVGVSTPSMVRRRRTERLSHSHHLSLSNGLSLQFRCRFFLRPLAFVLREIDLFSIVDRIEETTNKYHRTAHDSRAFGYRTVLKASVTIGTNGIIVVRDFYKISSQQISYFTVRSSDRTGLAYAGAQIGLDFSLKFCECINLLNFRRARSG